MLTVPLPSMRSLLIQHLPAHSVYVGDDAYFRRTNQALADYDAGHINESAKNLVEAHQLLKMPLREMHDYMHSVIPMCRHVLESNPPALSFEYEDGRVALNDRANAEIYYLVIRSSGQVRQLRIPANAGKDTAYYGYRRFDWFFYGGRFNPQLGLPYVLVDFSAALEFS